MRHYHSWNCMTIASLKFLTAAESHHYGTHFWGGLPENKHSIRPCRSSFTRISPSLLYRHPICISLLVAVKSLSANLFSIAVLAPFSD